MGMTVTHRRRKKKEDKKKEGGGMRWTRRKHMSRGIGRTTLIYSKISKKEWHFTKGLFS